jgi:choice-of-anchor B domain-containing protein
LSRIAFITAFLLAFLLPAPTRAQGSRNVILLAHLNQHAAYSACWSYVHPDGREYAILGTTDGTAIVNVTDPTQAHEVAFIPGEPSAWREMKQYQTYVYVSTEAAGGGIQVIDMQDPENPVLLGVYTTGFNREHTLEVDPVRGLLYANGTRLNSIQTGMRVLSLADPVNPVDLGGYTADYVHDCYPRGDTLFASCIQSNTLRVLDVSDPASIHEITSWTYPGAKTHSAETSKDGRYLYVCDETNYGTMKVFDIQDVMIHPEIMEITVNPLAIVHNVHVKEDTAFVAYYTEGIRLFDIADPSCPAEFGWYDTYAGYSGGFHGVWELAPRFPSGIFIASDINTGLYVFRADPNYGVLKLKVLNPSLDPVYGADVTVGGEEDSTRTQGYGVARLALAPGGHSIRVSRFGYESAFLDVVTTRGAHDSIQVVLQPMPLATVTGVVRRESDSAPLLGADLDLQGTPVSGESTAGGAFTLSGVPGGTYRLSCDRVGYAPVEQSLVVEPGVSRTVDLTLRAAAWYDSCDTDRGWSTTAPGDDATAGQWERAVPVGSSQPSASPAARFGGAAQHDIPAEGLLASGPVAPGADHTPGDGGLCFVTANGVPGKDPSESDVDGGRTTLTTPPLDMRGLRDPYVHFARWYCMNSPGDPDSFLVDISADGASWVNVRSIKTSDPAWRHETFRVRDYVTPGPSVRVRFVAQDQGPEGIVEAAVDDFELYDAEGDTLGIPTPPVSELVMGLSAPRPNPAAHSTVFLLTLPAPAHARVAVYDFAGREVRVLHDGPASAGFTPFAWDGRDSRGRAVGSGVYWIRAVAGARSSERKLVWVR